VLTCRQYQGHATADLGDLRGARPIIEDALVRQRRILGDDHQGVRRTTKVLADAYVAMGKKFLAQKLLGSKRGVRGFGRKGR
jgi:hypothetical protein